MSSFPVIPPPYKYKSQFDALRPMGFPARQIVSALDSADGEVEVAAAMLLSSTAQMIEEDEHPGPTSTAVLPPPSSYVRQPSYAPQLSTSASAPAPTTAQRTPTSAASTAKIQNHHYPEETKKNGKKSNDISDIMELLLEHCPDGIDGSKVKLLFQQKFGRKLSLPDGMALTTWMKSVPGVSISSNTIGLPVFHYKETEGTTSPSKRTTKVAKVAATKMINTATSTSHPPESRTNDWKCSCCETTNFEWRTECHTCSETKDSTSSKTETTSSLYAPIVEKPYDVRIMTTFKTTKCKDPACLAMSSSRECPHFHNDGDRRRNPYDILYAPEMCDTKPKGIKGRNSHITCMEGDACLFSHNVFEQMFHPLRYKKFPCRFRGPLHGPNLCPNAAKVCAFTHGLEDSRVPKDVTKLQASTTATKTTKATTTKADVTPNDMDKMMPALKMASPVAVSSYIPSPPPISKTTKNQHELSSTSIPPITVTNTENSKEKVRLEIPSEYCCCLSKALMEDPVLAADGNSYDRTAIETYFQKCRQSQRTLVSPVTGEDLLHTFLVPNHSIRIAIDALRESIQS